MNQLQPVIQTVLSSSDKALCTSDVLALVRRQGSEYAHVKSSHVQAALKAMKRDEQVWATTIRPKRYQLVNQEVKR